MLTLMLLRHAKAVPHGREADFSRDLTDKGETDAVGLGAYLTAVGLVPEFAFVSSAVRTRRTYELLWAGNLTPCDVRFEKSLYNATAFQLRDLLKLAAPSKRSLMMIGHNPGIMEAAVLLARDGDPIELSRLRNRFPPCALAVLSFDSDNWQDARTRGGRLDALLLPEDIPTGA